MCVRVMTNCFVELINWIRVVLWMIELVLLMLWKMLIRCKSADDAIDEISELVEHKAAVAKRSSAQGASTMMPETFHSRRVQTEAVPIYYPETVEELRELMMENELYRPIGSGHSFRPVVETDGVLISLERMNRILKVEGTVVTLQAGVKIRHAIRILERDYGLALRNMGNYDRQSLGSAITGGTHGTSGSRRDDTFTSSIVRMKMINALGEDVVLSPEDSVTFGLGGIIHEVTLDLVDFYYLRQKSTNIPMNQIRFGDWFDCECRNGDHDADADTDANANAIFTFVRWNFPGLKHETIQLVEFFQSDEGQYKKDRYTAVWDRFLRCFTFASSPFLPTLMQYANPIFHADKEFVDTYYRQYVDDPAPHHTEWEYAVPYTTEEEMSRIVRSIPDAVSHIPYITEIHLRISPKDDATAHLAHRSDTVWFDLNVVTPKGLSDAKLDEIGRPFEDLMVRHGGIAHPHKLVVDISQAGFESQTMDYLNRFADRHDPTRKLLNPALARMTGQKIPPGYSSTSKRATAVENGEKQRLLPK